MDDHRAPSIPKLAAAAEIAEVAEALHAQGAVIVEGLARAATMDALRAELSPWLAQSRPGPGEFRGWHTRRVGALCARSAAYRELAVNPTALGVAEHLLLPHCARIQLTYTQLIEIDPGEKAQPLHRDDEVWPWPRRPAEEWAVVGMWAVSDFEAANGATRVVPGSHRWSRDRLPAEAEVGIAAMEKGSLLLHFGSALHGGGANGSDRIRLGASVVYSLGWLRQVENQYLAVPPEIARRLSPALQDLLGYAVHGRILGECALEDPRVALLERSAEEVARTDRLAGAGAEPSTLSGYRTR